MKLSCLTWGRRLPGRLAGVAASAWLVAGCAGVSGSPPALLDYQPEDFSVVSTAAVGDSSGRASTYQAASKARRMASSGGAV